MHGNLHPQVDDLVKALGVESGISKSEVSRICGELDGEVAALRSRSLGHTRFPYLFMDATSSKAPTPPDTNGPSPAPSCYSPPVSTR